VTSQSRPSRYEAKPTLALFSFSSEGMIDEDVALYTGFLRLELHQTRSFILVERIQINELLNEKNYDRMDCNTSDCAVEIGKLVGITRNSVTSIRNKSYWNYNNLNPKDPVALNLFTQKDLIEALEKAERRVKREKKQKEKAKLVQQNSN